MAKNSSAKSGTWCFSMKLLTCKYYQCTQVPLSHSLIFHNEITLQTRVVFYFVRLSTIKSVHRHDVSPFLPWSYICSMLVKVFVTFIYAIRADRLDHKFTNVPRLKYSLSAPDPDYPTSSSALFLQMWRNSTPTSKQKRYVLPVVFK